MISCPLGLSPTFRMSVILKETSGTGSANVVQAVGLKDLESRPRRTLSQKNSYIGLSSDPVSYHFGRRLAGSAVAKGSLSLFGAFA